jgi:hypothetical protein
MILDRYIELEQSFLKQNGYRLGSSSQFRHIYELLLSKIRNSPIIFNKNQYWGKLLTAEQIIDYIVSALRAYWIDAPADYIWSPVDPDSVMFKKPNYWSEASPVDTVALQQAAARYIEEPWMQLNIIDWYILNGFIFDELLRTSELTQSEALSRGIRREHVVPGAKSFNSVFDKLGRDRVKSIILWFLIPAVLLCLYYFGHSTIAALVLLPYTLYMAVYLLSLPERFSEKRKLKPVSCDFIQRQNRLSQLYQIVSASAFNPSRLKEQMTDNEGCGIHLNPVIQVIVDRAIERDPSVFTI